MTSSDDSPAAQAVEDTPTVHCSRCDETWELGFELDELQVGNRALEQFALDHHRHTGHYLDEVTPWMADCRQCPDGEEFLAERPARRFARIHSRHTGHDVTLQPPDSDGKTSLIQPPSGDKASQPQEE